MLLIAEPLCHVCSTLALRLDLSGDPTFSQALRRAKDMAVSAFAHGSTPFAKVVEHLHVVRSAAFTPLYQVAMLPVDLSSLARLAVSC
jgi:non-ribosomal peptide synthetase component F